MFHYVILTIPYQLNIFSSAHTVGRCHADRSGFDGAWTETPLKFDNSYFTEMLAKEYVDETTAQGCPQKKHASSGTIMLISDLALLEAPFCEYVELYAKDQEAFFKDYVAAWVKLQENGCDGLRDTLSTKKNSCCSDQMEKMKSTADWWSLWIGLASFLLAMILVFAVPYEKGSVRASNVVPGPMRWESNPLDAWDVYALVGSILLLVYFSGLYLIALRCMGKLKKNPAIQYAKGFFLMGIIALLSLWLGRNRWCSTNGLSYAIFSILFGMIITNSPIGNWGVLSSLKLTSKDGEFFIKCSLALLATEFSILAKVGLPALVVAWIGSPLALVLGYIFGKKVFKMETEIALLTAVGATWCGASAISATGSVIDASSKDITLSISVVAFFTVIFTFVQPYFALGVGMNEDVAGAWIGASVDQTGNVIASAAIISEQATEIAAIVKIVLNSGLGILCTIIAFWWQTKTNPDGRKFSWYFLWDKFPKFVLGYFLCSAVLSIMLPLIQGTAEYEAVPRAVKDMNRWWFGIGFVGIGLQTNLKELWKGAVGSGVIQGYLVSNLFDMGIALGLSYALF